MLLVVDFVSIVGIWVVIVVGLFGLGWLICCVFGFIVGFGLYLIMCVLLIDVVCKIGLWVIFFVVIMWLECDVLFGFVLVVVLVYVIVWGVIIMVGVVMLFLFFFGSVYWCVVVEYLFKYGMWLIFLMVSLGVCGDVLVDLCVVLVLGGLFSLLLVMVCNVVVLLMLVVGVLWVCWLIG